MEPAVTGAGGVSPGGGCHTPVTHTQPRRHTPAGTVPMAAPPPLPRPVTWSFPRASWHRPRGGSAPVPPPRVTVPALGCDLCPTGLCWCGRMGPLSWTLPSAGVAARSPHPAPSSGPSCSVPSIPWGHLARATGWAGWALAGARGDRAGRAGWTRRRRRRAKKRRRRRRPCWEPPAARATSGDVITGTNSHLAQRHFQLPAALPRHRALFRGSPGLTTAPL